MSNTLPEPPEWALQLAPTLNDLLLGPLSNPVVKSTSTTELDWQHIENALRDNLSIEMAKVVNQCVRDSVHHVMKTSNHLY